MKALGSFVDRILDEQDYVQWCTEKQRQPDSKWLAVCSAVKGGHPPENCKYLNLDYIKYVAYHEAGHAVVGLAIGRDSLGELEKVTIFPDPDDENGPGRSANCRWNDRQPYAANEEEEVLNLATDMAGYLATFHVLGIPLTVQGCWGSRDWEIATLAKSDASDVEVAPNLTELPKRARPLCEAAVLTHRQAIRDFAEILQQEGELDGPTAERFIRSALLRYA